MTVTLFHTSDLHFGAEDRAALDWFAGLVAAERPSAVIVTGDLTMRARHHEFAAAGEWLTALDAPVTVEVGNHDLPYFNPYERFTDPYRRYGRMAGLVEREIDLPGLHIVPLRTTSRAQWRLDWSKGTVREKSLHAALHAIDHAPPDRMILVAAHHPLVEVGTHGKALTHGGQRALHALTRAGVTAVLSGHVHDPFDLVQDSAFGTIRMIGAGTLSERLRTTPPSFNMLTLSKGQLDVTVRSMR